MFIAQRLVRPSIQLKQIMQKTLKIPTLSMARATVDWNPGPLEREYSATMVMKTGDKCLSRQNKMAAHCFGTFVLCFLPGLSKGKSESFD